MDFGERTLKQALEKKLGTEKAAKVIKSLSEAHDQGKSGEELHKHYKAALAQEGHADKSGKDDISYGFFIP